MKWKLVNKNISELREYGKNPRTLTEKGIKDLTESIKRFGLAEPLVINTDGLIVGGHGRLKVLQQLNINQVDCYEPEKKLTDKQVEQLNIRLNKNIAGEWDFDILANEFEIDDLLSFGFENHEIIYNSVNEVNEWQDLVEFNESEKFFKISIIFESEKQRDIFVKNKEINITHKHNNQWISKQ